MSDETKASKDASARAYQVLALKYRPQKFEDLIGHEAMVCTLKNAFAADRIAHAYRYTTMGHQFVPSSTGSKTGKPSVAIRSRATFTGPMPAGKSSWPSGISLKLPKEYHQMPWMKSSV